jgi:hypothetical protein
MEAADDDYTNCLAKIRKYDQRTKAEIADRAVIGTPKKPVSTSCLISIRLLNIYRRARRKRGPTMPKPPSMKPHHLK